MKWKSKRQKERELRTASWAALPSIDPLFTDENLAALKARRPPGPPSLDQRFNKCDLIDLQKSIYGLVVLPTDASYHRDRQMTVLSVQEFPQLIVFCEVATDVRTCLSFAHKFGLCVAIRSGGHSTGGYSVNSEMVIDVSRIKDIVIDHRAKRAMVGAGASIGDLNARLNLYELHVPIGNCHDVCVGGFMQGGGYGFSSRMFGMNCDAVVEVVVMLASGRIVTANASHNKDLFWAVRGGAGGNFGVLLQITYALHPLGHVWGFGLKWPIDTDGGIDEAAAALVELQKNYMRSGAPKELGYLALVTWEKERPCLLMRGMYLGTQQLGETAIASIRKCKGAIFKDFGTGPYSKIDHDVVDGLPPVPDLAREEKQSGYIAKPLKESDWSRMLRLFLKSPNRSSLVCMEPYGGAISAIEAGTNAFIHRDVDMDLFLDVFWMSEDKQRTDAIAFLDRFIANMAPHFNGQEYQNYPRRSQTNYRRAYWGEWYGALLAVKRKYDPNNFFNYGQNISPEPDAAKAAHVIKPSVELPGLGEEIAYEVF